MTGARRLQLKHGAPRRRAAPFRCRLVVMAKAPAAGNVKTRLAHDVGVAIAVRFARHATAALLARMSHCSAWQTIIAIAPDNALVSRFWPANLARMPQGRGDLGMRMRRIMQSAAPGPVVIIGTDIPGISAAHVREAFRLLGRHDAVFGPANDGGYWLVGLRRRPVLPKLFEGVRWSTPYALADTRANLNGYSIALLPNLTDVDTAHELAGCAAIFGRRVRQGCR